MALQGSIDTFALDDVLRLVSSTGKTGRLGLRGSRGEGELVLRDGFVLDGSVTTDDRVGDLHELVFELLRFEDGDFQFDAVEVQGLDEAEPLDVEGLIEGAGQLLAEWREIERVVPNASAAVTLVADAPGGTVKIEPGQWRLIAAVGAGARVGELSERLDASHLAIGRLLRSLVGAGLVAVDDAPLLPPPAPAPAPPIVAAPPASETPTEGYAPYEPPAWAEPPAAPAPNGNGNGSGHGTMSSDILFDSVPAPSMESVPAEHGVYEGISGDAGESFEAPSSDGGVDPADFARRLAELPPKAAKAVAKAARASSQEERDAALAELDGTGESVDHEALIQLLGPVES